jgi:O-antigen biosynthesis protein
MTMTYEEWLALHEVPTHTVVAQQDVAAHARRPLRTLVVVQDHDGTGEVEATLQSLVGQSWPYWEAAVVTGEVGQFGDERVRWYPTSPGAVVGNTNEIINIEKVADLLVFVEPGDRLAADCLYHLAVAAGQDPIVDLVYWDDDVFDRDGSGRRSDPRIRPGWSPEMLIGANYIGRSFAIRRSRYAAIGGFRPDLGDAFMWDLLLRAAIDEPERVQRIPRVLMTLHERPAEQVTADGLRAVTDHLQRHGMPARAVDGGHGSARVDWDLRKWPKASVLVPTRHNRPMLSRLLPTLARTEYAGEIEVVIVDNGGRSDDNEQWYRDNANGLDLKVEWWDRPFNYSGVNNLAVSSSSGELLVFLNDDTEVLDPSWLRELAGWTSLPSTGAAGLHLLDPEDRIQFAGTIVGLHAFAEHVFGAMAPHSRTIFGSTDWYRNVLAVTGACLAVRRQAFEAVGGWDERFPLCGNDVVLGLDLHNAGYRNVVSPFAALRHHESATRGKDIPEWDFFASYWRYQSFIFGGDPFFSPNLSLTSREPKLREPDEPSPGKLLEPILKRGFEVFRQRNDAAEAASYADTCRASKEDLRAIRALHAQHAAPFEPETVNWFIPDLDSPFYGGINTAFRIADHLARNHGVTNRFVVWGRGPELYVRTGLTAAFPAIGDSEIVFHDGTIRSSLLDVPEADVSIATLWVTAYQLAHFPKTKRKFYLMQDFEPVFHPAGTLYALAEESYRLGLYGICNTEVMGQIYRADYGGIAHSFVPAIDPALFNAEGREPASPDRPTTVFVYARPGHWRNCWEMASIALKELKQRLGDRVRIVAAGSWATPESSEMDMVVRHLGLAPYSALGRLYRSADVGLTLTVSRHPSYIPLELMACGAPSVAFDSRDFHWLLRHESNSLLAERTVDGLVDSLERLCVDHELRQRLSEQGLRDIAANHSSWEKALAGIYPFMCDPGAARGSAS